MRRGHVLVVLAASLCVFGATTALATVGGVHWGTAIEVPGIAALNVGGPNGGDAAVESMSCPSSGNCSAGGFYADADNNGHLFVVDEKNGAWGTALEIPGLAALAAGSDVWLFSLSCANPGNCAAGGYYRDGGFNYQAFIVDETNGVWGNAIEVPGTAVLNGGGYAVVNSVSCPSAGNCTAGGYYTDGNFNHGSGNVEAYVVDETNGVWGDAIEVPGTAALNSVGPPVNGDARVFSVSCPSAGNCVAGGRYNDAATGYQAFIAEETNGVWGGAVEVPGSAALNVHGGATVLSVSCPGVGNCTAGGNYLDQDLKVRPFVVDQHNGVWGKAILVPATASPTTTSGLGYFGSTLSSLSCGSPGNCVTGGTAEGPSEFRHQAWVAVEQYGHWGKAHQAPGTPLLNTSHNAAVLSVSCASGKRCAVVGYYTTRALTGLPHRVGFVAREKTDLWSTAVQLPGTASLNPYGLFLTSVACAPTGTCGIGGSYGIDRTTTVEAFVTTP